MLLKADYPKMELHIIDCEKAEDLTSAFIIEFLIILTLQLVQNNLL